jgi:hypothetical protein
MPIYVGQTVNPRKRLVRHKLKIPECYRIEIIAVCCSHDDADMLEQWYYDNFSQAYNLLNKQNKICSRTCSVHWRPQDKVFLPPADSQWVATIYDV